ncbi:SOS response-associated peptidase [Subtercola sp. PAMC28395]|uniref:SOS response-associated peptidase n=1 Tax=Subtercola sp. PAMC28395 TaxID=2846775 RepID=UPI001C0C40D9|nr:SOS response-associated peptidase [Subtercola sp. PAMC28395]QWT23827.1 SOS response-associated peptidase [Subtercola sp. PAMC28395]
MCGRFAMNKETDDLILEFVARGGRAEDWRPSYSVAPTDVAPIIRQRKGAHAGDSGTGASGSGASPSGSSGSGSSASGASLSESGAGFREIEIAAWGLKPAWAKPGGPAPINARLESVATNGMFRSAFASSRCLVPMTGYYEWQAVSDGKQPYFIHAGAGAGVGVESTSASRLLAAAGLYSARKLDDEWAVTFTIITREARDASGEVHDRMPVFLTPDAWDAWLDPRKIEANSAGQGAILDLLDRSSTAVASTITTYAVDRRVNNSRTLDSSDATLIEPLDRSDDDFTGWNADPLTGEILD